MIMKNLSLYLIATLCLISCSKKEYDPSLVGHWALNGDANDLSSYQSHGEIFGNPKEVEGILKGKALDFNGDDFIEIVVEGNCPPQLKELSNGSISLWFKLRYWDVDNTMLPIILW